MVTNLQEQCTKLAQFVDHVQGLLGQGWFYQGSAPGRDQSECRITECFDLLALLAELVGDIQRMGDACEAFVVEGKALGLSTQAINAMVGVDLAKLAIAHQQLATELSAAGNRAVELVGAAKHVG